MDERKWDYTTLDTFLTCRKKYEYMMVHHLRRKFVAPALDFGQGIHAGLATYYKGGTLVEAVKSFEEIYKDRDGEELRTVANGAKMLQGYTQVYANEPFKVLAVEVGFAIPIGKIVYCGRIDALIDWDGQLYVLEHKTTGRLDANSFKQFSPDMQVDGYTYGAGAYMGRKCQGTWINMLEIWKELKRPTEKSKKLEDHFARDCASRNEIDMKRFEKEVQEIVGDVLECERKGEFYRNEHSCRDYNSDCPYRDLCLYGMNDRIVEKDFKVELWVPYKEEV